MAERHESTSFLMLQTEKTSQVAPLLKSIYYKLGAINLYLEGATISVSTIC